jgi:hypoxanthine phosphoribosyltransferase
MKYKTIFSEAQIKQRVISLANEINQDFNASTKLIVISVLKGSLFFTADLCRELIADLQLDTLQIRSYENSTVTSGKPVIVKDIDIDIKNQNVLIVEDIVDSGHSIDMLLKHLAAKKPLQLKVCSLLKKNSRVEVDTPLDYTGFEVDVGFLLGYGLDYQERYRQLKDIVVVEELNDQA